MILQRRNEDATAIGTYPPKRLSEVRAVTHLAAGFGEIGHGKTVGIAWPVPPQSVVRVLPIGRGDHATAPIEDICSRKSVVAVVGEATRFSQVEITRCVLLNVCNVGRKEK